jgi:hypothetical protein
VFNIKPERWLAGNLEYEQVKAPWKQPMIAELIAQEDLCRQGAFQDETVGDGE